MVRPPEIQLAPGVVLPAFILQKRSSLIRSDDFMNYGKPEDIWHSPRLMRDWYQPTEMSS